jgi:hypothetical protein
MLYPPPPPQGHRYPPSPPSPPPSWTQFAHIGITTQSISSSAYNTSLGSQTSNDTVWWTSCSAAQTLSGKTNPAIMLTMGSVVDYFRPTANHTLCEMLSSADKHDWSNDGVTWVTPAHLYWIMGGSAYEWPKHNVQGDDRDYLSMWGAGTGSAKSGCCHSALDEEAWAWSRTFDMYVDTPPALPPPITPPSPPSPPITPPSPPSPPLSWTQFAHIGITTQSISSSAYNTSLGSQTSNDAVWWTSCSAAQTLSGSTNPAIKLTMGSVVDYFRPMADHTLCEMLSSSQKHDWSNDGVTWVTPAHYYGIMGGSAYEWPKHNVQGDDRDYLSMWGTGTHPEAMSGCCHNALDDASGWYKTFDMYVVVSG